MNKYIIALVLLVALALFAYVLFTERADAPADTTEQTDTTTDETADMGVDTEPLPEDTIVGAWVSIEDSNFTRTIYENGGFMDAYEGSPEATTNGAWVTFDAETAPGGFPFSVEDGARYLQLDSGDEVLYFKIAELTTDSLTLIYLNRGGVLEFSRVVEVQ